MLELMTGYSLGGLMTPRASLIALLAGGLAISRAMERAMRGCDAMIVNLTPFRGPSADVGSAYEMGFMRALGRPIFAYSNDIRSFLERVAAFCGAVRVRPTGEHEDSGWHGDRGLSK